MMTAQPEPGDVPMSELQPLLDDPRLSFEAVGIYAFVRSNERHDGTSSSFDPKDETALSDLIAAGHIRETPFGYRTTRAE